MFRFPSGHLGILYVYGAPLENGDTCDLQVSELNRPWYERYFIWLGKRDSSTANVA